MICDFGLTLAKVHSIGITSHKGEGMRTVIYLFGKKLQLYYNKIVNTKITFEINSWYFLVFKRRFCASVWHYNTIHHILEHLT